MEVGPPHPSQKDQLDITENAIIPDQAVIDFLSAHGVNECRPPAQQTLIGEAAKGLMTGVFGPLVGAANYGLYAQEKNSKEQAWRSWKQWALGHPEWHHFWEAKKAEYLEAASAEALRREAAETQKTHRLSAAEREEARRRESEERRNQRLQWLRSIPPKRFGGLSGNHHSSNLFKALYTYASSDALSGSLPDLDKCTRDASGITLRDSNGKSLAKYTFRQLQAMPDADL